jgi:hypothetical protein
MRPRIDGPGALGAPATRLTRPGSEIATTGAESLREATAVAELFLGVFRRDLLGFYPQTAFTPLDDSPLDAPRAAGGPNFRLIELDNPGESSHLEVEMFGVRYGLDRRDGEVFSAHDRRMIRAIGAVLVMRYHHLFRVAHMARLELFRGGSEDHYVAAFIEPSVYELPGSRPSRIAATIQTLRTAALSTYENHRVSTGALLIGPRDDPAHTFAPTPPDALAYGVELTGLKSVHRLCDGKRTLFLVDRAGNLAGILDIERFASEVSGPNCTEVPCARDYRAHARATRVGGHVCLVLSPNQEIKLFTGGTQAFAFAHGRWRILDPAAKFALWRAAVSSEALARALFQAALNLAEVRQGALFVVAREPEQVVGRLLAPHDLLSAEAQGEPPSELGPREAVAKRALHYLARGRNVRELDPAVLEALASLDGALVTAPDGALLAFGAILRHHDDLPNLAAAEGARTTAALGASRYGPVLKVSEDGVVSCFLDGTRAWDL